MKERKYGPRRNSRIGCSVLPGLPIVRGTYGSTEKIIEVFAHARVNLKTSEMHPDDQVVAVASLEKLGYAVRVRKNHFFIGSFLRATLNGPIVHFTDLRTCN